MFPMCIPNRQQLLTAGWTESEIGKFDYVLQWAPHYRKLKFLIGEIGLAVECFHDNTRAKKLVERAYKLAIGSADNLPDWIRPTIDTPTANAVEQFLQSQPEGIE